MKLIIEEVIRKKLEKYWQQSFEEWQAEEYADREMKEFAEWLFSKWCKETDKDRTVTFREW